MQDQYFQLVMMIERLHRLFLDVVKLELDRMKIIDINNIQAMILYNVGQSKLTVGEIANRGYYLGSNVTYNLKKLVKSGYLIQEISPHDRRSSYLASCVLSPLFQPEEFPRRLSNLYGGSIRFDRWRVFSLASGHAI